MASTKNYLEYVLESMPRNYDISYRPMMGEYILYTNGKIFGGIYDDRFLIKDIPVIRTFFESPKMVIPYPNAKPMIEIEDIEDSEMLISLLEEIDKHLPEPKKK